jgi:hypothetical protein
MRNTTLTCSCCGTYYLGQQSEEHDAGYGTCDSCVETVVLPKMNEMLDSIVVKIENGLSPERAKSFKEKTQQAKRDFAMRCVEEGLIGWSF